MSEIDAYVGKNVFVRTVTFYYTGHLASADDAFLRLEQAAWIAETGYWSETLAKGTLNEVEPYPNEVLVARGSIVDVCEWKHNLPREKK